MVAGWQATVGHDWNPIWLTEMAAPCLFGFSDVATGAAGGSLPSGGSAPPPNIFGGTDGLQQGFARAFPSPPRRFWLAWEPSPFWFSTGASHEARDIPNAWALYTKGAALYESRAPSYETTTNPNTQKFGLGREGRQWGIDLNRSNEENGTPASTRLETTAKSATAAANAGFQSPRNDQGGGRRVLAWSKNPVPGRVAPTRLWMPASSEPQWFGKTQ